jgi:enediyne biosynthesis protein E4
MRSLQKKYGFVLLISSVFGLLALAQDEATPVIPKYLEETKSGISSVYNGDWEYMVGGGVASFDCSNDGLPDVLLAGGTNKAVFYRNTSSIGGALTFKAQKSNLELKNVTGAYPLDVDADGITDVMVLRVGENVLFRGLGNCGFERANEKWAFDGGDAWHTSFAATWEKNSSLPTLAVGSYIDRTKSDSPWGSCTNNLLYRGSNGKYAAPQALKPSYCALSMLFTDWNRSGTPSLRVSNDREYYKGGQEQLWKLEPGKPPTPYTEADGWKKLVIWGMGIASYDLNGDGFPEYFMTSMADSKLQSLSADSSKPTFGDIAFKLGVTAHRPYTGGDVHPSTGWHAQFEDVNNDSYADLFIAKGNVAKMPDFAAKDPNNLLLQKPDGTFLESGDKAGVASLKAARGAAVVDFNLDGQLDILVVNRHDKAQIWRNTSVDPKNHWLELKLQQPGANRDAIGSWVEVQVGTRTIRREITIGGGHASGSLGWIHFGIGNLENTKLRVQWNDGVSSDWMDVNANQFLKLERDQALQVWNPGSK